MRQSALVTSVLALAFGCALGDRPVRRTVTDRVETVDTEDPSPSDEEPTLAFAALEHCASEVTAPHVTPRVFGGRIIGEVRGVTFMLGNRIRDDHSYTTVLVALGAGDDLMVHDLGIETLAPLTATTIEGDRIRVLWFSELGQTPRWLVIDVSDPDAPRIAQAAREVPGLRERGWINGLASDGTRAIVAMSLADDHQVVRGESAFLIDAVSGERIRAWEGSAARAVFADRAAGFVTINNEQVTLTVIRPDGQEETARLEVPAGCAAERFVREDGVDVMVFGRQRYGGWHVGRDGSIRSTSSDQWPADACAYSPTARGEVIVDRRLVRPEGGRFVATPPLAADESGDAMVVGDELLSVHAVNSSGMMHSPTDDDGMRRYFHWYRFDRAEVVRVGLADGTRRGSIPLPFAAREGHFESGPRVSLMRRGARIAALLTGEGGLDGAEHVDLFGPCPAPE